MNFYLLVIDAMGKIPSGLLDGTLSSVGDYKQCLNIKSPPFDENGQTIITGKYCLARPIIPYTDRTISRLNKTNQNGSLNPGIPDRFLDELSDFLYLFNGSFINIGICLPSVCSANEIEQTLNSILYPLINIPIEIGPENNCQTASKNEEFILDSYQWLSM